MKPWPDEALIERWFPLYAREQTCFDLVEDTNDNLSKRSDRHPHWREASMPIADAWLMRKRTRFAARTY
jgi:hypothetical protein